jgi:hypothetical protein
MIDLANTCLFIPAGLKDFKLQLFERIGTKLGKVIRGDVAALAALPSDIIPIVGCSPELRERILRWRGAGRTFVYWDRGYARRVFATWLPRGEDGGYYRWHVNSYQMQSIRAVSADRWDALKQPITPWAQNPNGHIVLAAGSPTYERFHGIEGWIERTGAELKKHTDREIRVSDKETKEPLSERIKGAHALVSHGSNAAVEAAIMGCPVFVSSESAAALVGQTDLSKIETPIYPDRTAWAHSLAYCQFNETELVDGTLWRLIA